MTASAGIRETLLQEVSVLSPDYCSEVLGFIEALKAGPVKPEAANEKRPFSEMCGIFKGKIWMADDFDAPLEEMREYME